MKRHVLVLLTVILSPVSPAFAESDSELLFEATSNGASQKIKCDDYTKLLFPSEATADPKNIYDAPKSTLIPPAGVWQINASVMNVRGSSKDGVFGLVLFRNGKAFRFGPAQQGARGVERAKGLGAGLNYNVVSSGKDKFEIYAYYGSCRENAYTVETTPAGSSNWLQVNRLSGGATSATASPTATPTPTPVATAQPGTPSPTPPISACPYSGQGNRGQNGATFSCYCDPNDRTAAAAWGTDIYTDDSSLCLAAAHAGAIKNGVITYVIAPGQASYPGSLRNDVQTLSYGSWVGSVTFVK